MMENNKIDNLLGVFRQHFEIADEVGFTLIIAAAVAHQVPGEMLWLRLYGASRSGKTEVLRAIATHGDSTELEVFTPASIRGGFKAGHKLLKRLDGKLVITKDIAPMLTVRKEARNEVFGLLRNVKDGTLISDFGTEGGELKQQAKFDWIIGTTPAFAQYRQFEDLLGSRYVDLNWRTGDRDEMVTKAMENNPRLSEIRDAVAKAVSAALDEAKGIFTQYQPPQLHNELKSLVADWANLTALLRSPVARDRHHRVTFHPEAEVGTDLAQALSRITLGLMFLGIRECEKYIARLCQDSIAYSRQQAVRKLLSGGVVEQYLSVKPSTTRELYYDIEDFGELGIAEKHGDFWRIAPNLQTRMEKFVAWWA